MISQRVGASRSTAPRFAEDLTDVCTEPLYRRSAPQETPASRRRHAFEPEHRNQVGASARYVRPAGVAERAPTGHSACVSEVSDRYPESLREGLPRDESYPLTRSELDAALLSHGVEQIDVIGFGKGGQRWADDVGKVVEVHFRAVGAYPERLALSVFSVPSRLKSAIATEIRGNALHEVAEWIAHAGRAETPWRSTDHRVMFRWEGGALHREDYDGLRARPW
jgi:hypothetical protein